MSHPELNLNCTVQRNPEIIAAEADQDVVMVNVAGGFYYGVSNIARAIWESIERPKKVSDLVDELTSAYNVDRSKCEEETLLFLGDLLTERLVQVTDEPPA
jgi:hypothetical protein